MLSNSNRLRSQSDFAEVRAKGKLLQSENLAINFFNRGDGGVPRVGIIVSTKISKSAVVRNKIKRAVREAVQEKISNVGGGMDIVFLVKSSILKLKREEIMKEVERGMKSAKLI